MFVISSLETRLPRTSEATDWTFIRSSKAAYKSCEMKVLPTSSRKDVARARFEAEEMGKLMGLRDGHIERLFYAACCEIPKHLVHSSDEETVTGGLELAKVFIGNHNRRPIFTSAEVHKLLYYLAVAKFQLGKHVEAQEQLAALLEVEPQYLEAHRLKQVVDERIAKGALALLSDCWNKLGPLFHAMQKAMHRWGHPRNADSPSPHNACSSDFKAEEGAEDAAQRAESSRPSSSASQEDRHLSFRAPDESDMILDLLLHHSSMRFMSWCGETSGWGSPFFTYRTQATSTPQELDEVPTLQSGVTVAVALPGEVAASDQGQETEIVFSSSRLIHLCVGPEADLSPTRTQVVFLAWRCDIVRRD